MNGSVLSLVPASATAAGAVLVPGTAMAGTGCTQGGRGVPGPVYGSQDQSVRAKNSTKASLITLVLRLIDLRLTLGLILRSRTNSKI